MSKGIEIVGYREGPVLRPWGEAAWTDFERIPQKPKLLVLEVKQPRNPRHSAKYWMILQRVARTDPEFTAPDEVHEWVKVKLRMFAEYKDYDGRILIRTQSISPASMDQIRFANFFDRAMWVLTERLGVDPEDLLSDEWRGA